MTSSGASWASICASIHTVEDGQLIAAHHVEGRGLDMAAPMNPAAVGAIRRQAWEQRWKTNRPLVGNGNAGPRHGCSSQ